ncbi:hypothetical protein Pelo_19824 [Pelomyxa schiedti]|nr:hypothetical protein Pelo_19824 [Pelomyxa schiedti]
MTTCRCIPGPLVIYHIQAVAAVVKGTAGVPEGAVKVFVYDDASSAGGGVYAGRLVDGERNGRGTCKWTNSNTYEGEWKDGLTHGRGVHWWADGNTYDGELRKGKEEGWGVPVA